MGCFPHTLDRFRMTLGSGGRLLLPAPLGPLVVVKADEEPGLLCEGVSRVFQRLFRLRAQVSLVEMCQWQ